MSTDLMRTCTEKDVLMHHVSVCGVCGQSHSVDECSFLEDIKYVSDEPVISRARQTLPKDLEIIRLADGSTTVITKVDLLKGTTFGPFHARRVSTMNPLSQFPIKVFGTARDETYYLDLSNEDCCNWMCFIASASNDKEQNLICYQVKQDIFYTAMHTIAAGGEIRVWYAPYYASKMKMPLYNKNFAVYNNFILPEIEQGGVNKVQQIKHYNKEQTTLLSKEVAEELANKLPAQQLGAAKNMEIWNCKFCLTTTKSVVSHAKHLMEHYKPLLGIFCDICNKKCNNASVLKRHKKAKHPELSDKAVNETSVNRNEYENSEMACPLRTSDDECEVSNVKEKVLKGLKEDKKFTDNILQVCPLLSDKEQKSGLSLLDSNLLNVSELLQNDRCLNINLGLGTISELIMPDNTINPAKFNVEELVPELLDTIHEKLNDFDCDICEKKFDKVDYLYRHLRKHTGEFICPSCLVVFARKENLLSHTCTSKNMEYNYECSICQKLFLEKKYLKRHMTKHNEINNCKWCHQVFSSVSDCANHKCVAPQYVCDQCKKRFVCKAHLNRHIKSHSHVKPTKNRIRKRKENATPAICEKCGDIFRNSCTLKQHLHTHGERMFECDICHSRFHRMAILKEHKTIHQSAQVPCNICGKRLKSKKALDIHMLLHGNKKHQCDKCDKSFFQKCNYVKHYKHMHEDKETYNCPHCSMVFSNKQSFDKHIVHHIKPTEYSCALCKKSFHKEYQLKRHVQTSHSGIVYRCPFCHTTARHRHSMRRHFERQHSTLRQAWDKIGFINHLAEKLSQFGVNEVNLPQHYSILKENYTDADSNEFKNIHIERETSEFYSTVSDDKVIEVVQEQEPNKQIENENNISGNEKIVKLIHSPKTEQAGRKRSTELSLNEVTQLSISEESGNLSETVLRSAYIYDDDGEDIMFYVLQ